jgi:phosphatidylserine/phosphatidylglycerophosphate/cardiolipin synthase-like enzyme
VKHIIAFIMAAGIALSAQASTIERHFSPNGGAEAAVVSAIGQAQHSLHIATYQLTNKRIADAILEAHARGVTVKLVVDRSQRNALKGDQYCCAAKVAKVIPTLLDAKHPIQHNKVIVIDSKTVITGSFNFSNAAEKSNAENLLIIRDDKELAADYIADWNKHAAHAEKY